MEGKTTFIPISDEGFGADLSLNPTIMNEPATLLHKDMDEADHTDHTVFSFGEDGNHSDSLTSNAVSVSQAVEMENGRVLCHLCKNVYKNRSSLATHLRVKHKLSGNTRAKMLCLEVGCDYRTNRIARLIKHLIQEHKMKFQCERVAFQKKDDFWKWRKEAEERCRSSYCADTSAKTMVSGDVKHFLRCRRSGYVKCHSRVSEKQGGNKGSVKINAVCTSFMEVIFGRDGGATVDFCMTHYGHAEDGQYLRLNTEERECIRQLILEGQTAPAIIATMKTKMPEHRHHLLKYSKIRNISLQQNLIMTRIRDKTGGSQRVASEVELSEAGEEYLTVKMKKKVDVQAEDGETYPDILPLDFNPHVSRCSADTEDCGLEEVRMEMKTGVEKVLHLTDSVKSEDTFKHVKENQDFLTNVMENQVNIEVIPELIESSEESG